MSNFEAFYSKKMLFSCFERKIYFSGLESVTKYHYIGVKECADMTSFTFHRLDIKSRNVCQAINWLSFKSLRILWSLLNKFFVKYTPFKRDLFFFCLQAKGRRIAVKSFHLEPHSC